MARVTRPSVPAVLSLTSHAQPLPWMPASAVLVCLRKASKEPKSESMAFCWWEWTVVSGVCLGELGSGEENAP